MYKRFKLSGFCEVLRLVKWLCLLFLPNIPEATFILNSRVWYQGIVKATVFSSRKQELLKYFSIFFLPSSFFLLPTLIKYCQYVIYTYIQVLLIIFLIISDYFFRFFSIFFDFFWFFQKNFFRHFYIFFTFLSTFFKFWKLFLLFNLFSLLFLREHWTYI